MDQAASQIKLQMNTSRRRAADSEVNLGETARNALKLLFESTPAPEKRKELLAALGNTTDKKVMKKPKNTKAMRNKTVVHETLAISFNRHGEPTDSDQDILSQLLQRSDENVNTPHGLQDLLALGFDGRSILHVILDPTTYDEEEPFVFMFERLKPFIRFLIRLHPGLPTVTDSSMRTPLFAALSETETEPEDQALSQETKQKIVSYMCEASSGGLGSQSAIDSLRVVCGDRLARCHAAHVAIEIGVSIHEDVVKQLSLLPAKMDRGDSKDRCLEVLDGKGRSCLHIALTSPFSATKIAWAKILAKLQPQLLKSTYTSDNDNRKTSLTPLQHFSEQRNKDKQERKKTRGKTSKEADSMNAKLDSLEDFLKQQCLATFDNATCKSIMYTRSNVREISLAFEAEDPVSGESLKRQSQHYKLDTTIRTVQIPSRVSVTWEAADRDAYEQVRSWDCFGRTDLYLIFHWLKNRDTLPVKKVFEVMVDDFGDEKTLPHSDKAIVESLKDLQVEIWDWARLDIPTEVIYEAAGDHVKTVYLYCSGLKVVLEAWADRNGLARLRNLEKVYLETNQGLESMETMKAYVEKFKKDLPRTFKEVNKRELVEIRCDPIKPAQKKNSGTASAASKLKEESEQGFAEQDWLKCMDQFADIIEMLERDKKMTPIKVALIDDGVKSSYATLDDSIERGDSWVHQPNPSQRRSKHGYSQNYNTSAHGHGTVMAYYICRMCPGVRLYVAKLNPEPKHGDGSGRALVSFSIESTVEAIKWAVAEKVDIISMSWAIEEKELDYQTNRMGALRDAIKLAADNNILLFCANPDKGAGYPENKSYPKQLDTSRVFCIGAATQDGTRWEKIDVGDASCDYFLPGVELGFPVESSGARRVGEPPTVWETYNGSSLSCALAAGLAAMILHCAQVSGKNATEAEYTWLKSHGGMRNAFNSIHVTQNKWLPVRRVFGHPSLVNATTSTEATMKALREEVVNRFFMNMPRTQLGPEQSPGKLRTRPTLREDEIQ
ncbi:hypothetical protein TGAM01_v201945 [Trichoderma gamsii]|uniref:Peptidase S8/S53 domain-containing protein n=1 Tax=Trichoderma gamsii TaxID=398673 RepID=A0A2P4ZX16_9HYPO|nr:hypothetical protein TGAM01_v201945 [Trichoderma gamsii]PON28837.1 hypothetical protein TGAM01_v201945 [Trichoderma gamsii]